MHGPVEIHNVDLRFLAYVRQRLGPAASAGESLAIAQLYGFLSYIHRTRKQTRFSSSGYAQITGFSRKTVSKHLSALVELGWVEREFDSKGSGPPLVAVKPVDVLEIDSDLDNQGVSNGYSGGCELITQGVSNDDSGGCVIISPTLSNGDSPLRNICKLNSHKKENPSPSAETADPEDPVITRIGETVSSPPPPADPPEPVAEEPQQSSADSQEVAPTAKPKRATVSSHSSEIIELWNANKPEQWVRITRLNASRQELIEKLYKGSGGITQFIKDLPVVLRAVNDDNWWRSKSMTFENFMGGKKAKSHFSKFLDIGASAANICHDRNNAGTIDHIANKGVTKVEINVFTGLPYHSHFWPLMPGTSPRSRVWIDPKDYEEVLADAQLFYSAQQPEIQRKREAEEAAAAAQLAEIDRKIAAGELHDAPL